VADPLTEGLATGVGLGHRILNARLAQQEHERRLQEAETRQQREESMNRFRELGLLLQLNQVGARPATTMDEVEADVGLTAAPEGIRPSDLGSRLHDFGENVGKYVLPKPLTPAEKSRAKIEEARQLEGVRTEGSLERLRQSNEFLTRPIPPPLAERLGIPPGTPVTVGQLIQAAREPAAVRPEILRTETGIFQLTPEGGLTALKDPKSAKRLRQPQAGGEGPLSQARFELSRSREERAERGEERAERGEQRAEQQAKQKELQQLEDQEADFHIERSEIGFVIAHEKTDTSTATLKLAQLKTRNNRLRDIMSRKVRLGVITQDEADNHLTLLDQGTAQVILKAADREFITNEQAARRIRQLRNLPQDDLRKALGELGVEQPAADKPESAGGGDPLGIRGAP
jgi:hypothetical protein